VNPQTRTFAAMLVLTALAAAFAGWVGVQYGMSRSQPDLDVLMHERLHLTPYEELQINALEDAYAQKRNALQSEMDNANRDLALAMEKDHKFGPDEARAIERNHRAMKALQEETIKHVLAMRAVLSPHQAQAFDALVARDLSPTVP
jgi:uncharacterized protein HemX